MQAKVEELERRLTEEKMSYEERLAEISMERLQIEERYSLLPFRLERYPIRQTFSSVREYQDRDDGQCRTIQREAG